ncbi:uncharacterized protein G2W53_007619 [Senna tora]|uniref:Uncharacterized protein n=1 Tax=Senna tora TaxID=362788 RepID=A0A834X6L4_9FABA|nr:uncharacterized protein G2W53_007619 [Senna tora]
MCSPHLASQPSSSASTGQPQQHVEELQHEVSTDPPQRQGTIDSTSVDSSAIIPRGRDPTDGKLWIQPCGQSFHPSIQPVRVIRKRVATGKEPPLPELFLKTHKKKDTGEFVDKRSAELVESNAAKANEESNAAIKQLQENYRNEIDELKKLIISSRNQNEQDDEASENYIYLCLNTLDYLISLYFAH